MTSGVPDGVMRSAIDDFAGSLSSAVRAVCGPLSDAQSKRIDDADAAGAWHERWANKSWEERWEWLDGFALAMRIGRE